MAHPFGQPAELHRRPPTPTPDHVGMARASFEYERDRVEAAIKTIDIRMENTEEAIAGLRRQLAEDRRELDALSQARRAAKRALAELDGVAP